MWPGGTKQACSLDENVLAMSVSLIGHSSGGLSMVPVRAN